MKLTISMQTPSSQSLTWSPTWKSSFLSIQSSNTVFLGRCSTSIAMSYYYQTLTSWALSLSLSPKNSSPASIILTTLDQCQLNIRPTRYAVALRSLFFIRIPIMGKWYSTLWNPQSEHASWITCRTVAVNSRLPPSDWCGLRFPLQPSSLCCVSPSESLQAAIRKKQTSPFESPGTRYFICYICHLFHKYDAAKDFGPRSIFFEDDADHLLCLLQWSHHPLLGLKFNASPWRNVRYQVYFLNLQLAMKRFYHGPQFGISTEAICHSNSMLPRKVC